ncbi:hypothetical protein GCM10023224_24910 [Streptomonospora halophila]|uniref:Uncharacterized protein n=1 Tax=Streptomonospora halophila TaxID=427369 RepID=A0ABP9GHP1_9ACTN
MPSELDEHHQRLYSASARMMWEQGPPAWRGDRWPTARRDAWRDLEAALSASPPAPVADVPADPARYLVSGRAPDARAVPLAAAVGTWEARFDADPVPPEPGTGVPAEGAVAIAAVWQTLICDLLDELAQRLAPGRPPCVITGDSAELADEIRALGGALRTAAEGAAAPSPAAAPAPAGDGGDREPESPVTGEGYARLRAAALAAARAMPTRAEAERAGDFTVRAAACAAAEDLSRVAEGGTAPQWRERRAGIDPSRHLVQGYRWSGGAARPTSFGQAAAGLRADRAGPSARPLDPADAAAWRTAAAEGTSVLLSPTAALIAAELLAELAARLTPGTRSGTVPLTGLAVHDFVKGRFRRAFIVA